ncbi:phosphoadenylyl-sulfate reductase [Pontibacter sp. G13]|uniref:phosphoadenylyl-sulfate reductase n=1 Tax=Pontibacter sp. G13 TaxID=3074898 RepID=UPI00288B7018|nr:phosphoadenylyl-sulfate reductase [Pontibacter sp. G13]WNJ19185.1 phosphoadenylyl-sulfate reductase [Pontibacter sp. G13]
MESHSIDYLRTSTADLSWEDRLEWLSREFPGKVCFSLGFGKEGMVIADAIFRKNLPIRVFTIDTGRLFPETYELMDLVRARYKTQFEVYFPESRDVEQYVRQHGVNGFYESVENRLSCCEIRKKRPLKRALEGAEIWITGLRKTQSDFRSQFEEFEWNEYHGLFKFNPLINWSKEEVDEYLETHRVPTNRLHKSGFPSIGCAPCTRAIVKGESERDGRWWWETSHKECGLHLDITREVKQSTSTPITRIVKTA